MSLTENTLLALANTVQELYDNLNRSNLLDTVYVNENVHSRILRLIMDYHENGRSPFFESFLQINKLKGVLPKFFVPGRPVFYNERDRIDLLIEGKDYAIVVENKIYNAVDQDRQLERYLESCIGRGIDAQRLIAIYLSANGSKNASPTSLTDRAREILGITDSLRGRYVEMNFRDDILPWLKDSIMKAKDKVEIQSALIQYADYLEGMFGERNNELLIKERMNGQMESNGINPNSIASYSENIMAVNTLWEKLIAQRDEKCCELAKKYISEPLQTFCAQKGINLVSESYSYGYLSLQISIPKLFKSAFRFNTEGDGRNIYGIGNYDVNDGEVLSDALIREPYRRSKWWPVYRYPLKREIARTASPDFWETTVPR